MKQGTILAFVKPQAQLASIKDARRKSDVTVSVETSEVLIQQDSNYGNQKAVFGFASTELPKKDLTYMLQDSRASVSKVLSAHIDRLKTITGTLLPVRYSDKFYQECLEPEGNLVVAFVALYDSKPVGWIRCRIEPFPNENNHVYKQLYIQALCILAPFRGLGLAKGLLDAAMDGSKLRYSDLHSILAHVWEKNEDALQWYERQSFSRIILQPQYYKRLKPSSAWIVRRELK